MNGSRVVRKRSITVLGAGLLGVLFQASAGHAELKITEYQDVFAKGDSRLYWAFNYDYPAEPTIPATGQCKGVLTQAANHILASYDSPNPPFAGLIWTYANSRQSATAWDLPGPLPCMTPPTVNSGCPGCNLSGQPPIGNRVNGGNAFDSFTASVAVSTNPAGKMKVTSYVIVKGDVLAGRGGLHTQALSDTAFAMDSISVSCTKSTSGADSIVTLNELSGVMRNNTGLSLETIANTFFVAVYPDSDAANADGGNTGAGALSYGRVHLTTLGAVFSGTLFSAADFDSIHIPDGSRVLTPRSGFSRTVVVPSLMNAVVVTVADPQSRRFVADVEPGPGPRTEGLTLSVAPNPFRGRLSLRLEVPEAGEAHVRVVDLAGRLVRTLHHGAIAAGVANLAWNGRDDHGRSAAPGVYLVEARVADRDAHARVLLLR